MSHFKGKFKKYTNLDLLTEINTPQAGENNFLLGKSFVSSDWFIYSSKENKIIFRSNDYSSILKEWKKTGNNANFILANVHNLSKYFQETEESLSQNSEDKVGINFILYSLVLELFTLLFFSVIISLGYKLYKRKKASKIA